MNDPGKPVPDALVEAFDAAWLIVASTPRVAKFPNEARAQLRFALARCIIEMSAKGVADPAELSRQAIEHFASTAERGQSPRRHAASRRAETAMKKAATAMEKSQGGPKEADSPSQLIDARIAALSDWRGETLARVRGLIKEADPEVVEQVSGENRRTRCWGFRCGNTPGSSAPARRTRTK
jgi:hypothetical protein